VIHRNRNSQTANTKVTRALNRSLILDHIKLSGSKGVTALARELGLHRTTVYSQVREMVDEGILTLGPAVQPRTGRPGALVALNVDGSAIIGAQLSITNVQAVVADLEGKILYRFERKIDPHSAFEIISRELVETIGKAVARARDDGRVPTAIGIAVPGLVDEAEGRILLSANLGWRNVDLGGLLRHEFDLPIWVWNGAHAAVLGERYFGVGRDFQDWVCLNLGVEISAGLFLHGDFYAGARGYAGEIGHTILQPGGPSCTCGNKGCWEALASERALLRYYHEAGGNHDLPLGGVIDRAGRGDVAAVDALEQVARYLAIGIVNLLHAFDPECIVIGGELARLDPSFLTRIGRHLQEHHLLTPGSPVSLLKLSQLGLDTALLGAVSVVLHRTLDGPRIV
jgi:predicted NBD/HSP70 family sugar kinase